MNKTFHFISGLPRSGSTLLANILAQNPRFEATASSSILAVITSIRENWDAMFAATPNEQGKIDVMRGILPSFYQRTAKPVVFDKCRGWLAFLEMAELILERKAKVLVPVRDMRDILASFEKLWRKNTAINQISQSSDEIRRQSQQAARGMAEQARAAAEVSSATDNIARQIKLVTDRNRSQSVSATSVLDLLSQVQSVAEQNTQSMRETNEKTDQFVQRIRRMSVPVVAG